MARLRGHALLNEGAPFSRGNCRVDRCTPREVVGVKRLNALGGVGGDGHGRCECKAMSGHLTSGAERRRWHAQHVEEERASMARQAEQLEALRTSQDAAEHGDDAPAELTTTTGPDGITTTGAGGEVLVHIGTDGGAVARG